MAKVDLPLEIQQSFFDYASYPLNIILNGTKNYHSTLKSSKEKLDENEGQLCLKNESLGHILIREIYDTEIDNHHEFAIHSSEELCEWLGINTAIDETDPLVAKSITTRTVNPKCRFIYIYSQNSRARLQVSRKMLTRILSYFQIMPAYLDFMFAFGEQSNVRNLRFTSFREQIMLGDSLYTSRRLHIPELSRSGREFQLCYNLKGIILKKRMIPGKKGKEDEWSIRQAAIHHQFDVYYGTSLWIVTKGRTDILDRFDSLTGPDGRMEDKSFGDLQTCFRSSLAVQLMLCYWSMEEWCWYISWLEEIVDKETSMALYTRGGPGTTQYRTHHIQELQRWKDRASEVVMVLEANISVITSIQRLYITLKSNRDFPKILRQDRTEDIKRFTANLNEIIGGLKMHVTQANLLVTIIGDRKELIIQHLQGQIADRTDLLNRNLEKEAVVMRIITLVTLLYLPATFVSTFFSTNIIHYETTDEQGGGIFSTMAMKSWLEATLPLTAITLLTAWLMYRFSDRMKYRAEDQVYQSKETIVKKPGFNIQAWKFWTWKENSRLPLYTKNIP